MNGPFVTNSEFLYKFECHLLKFLKYIYISYNKKVGIQGYSNFKKIQI